MRRFTYFDVSASVKEEYVEEIDLAPFIHSMLIAPSLEPRAAAPPYPTPVVIIRHCNTPRAAATDKCKGVYVLPPKKTPSTRPKGIVIGASVTMYSSEEEDEPI